MKNYRKENKQFKININKGINLYPDNFRKQKWTYNKYYKIKNNINPTQLKNLVWNVQIQWNV